jgi:hypothetical protein
MSTPSRYDGRIDIDPPLPWGLIKDSPSYPGAGLDADVKLVIEEHETDTDDGVIIRRRAVAIVPATDGSFKGYRMVEHIQAIIDAAGPRTFRGYIEAVSEEGDRWRIAVVDGRAQEFLPTLTWPAECE